LAGADAAVGALGEEDYGALPDIAASLIDLK